MTQKRPFCSLLKFLPILLCAIAAALCFMFYKRFNVQSIFAILPQNKLISAITILVLYAVKSVSVFIPLIVLNVAAGIAFKPAYALAVNAAGCIVVLTIPYLIGKMSGSDFADKLCKKHKKLSSLAEYQNTNAFWFSFLIRAVSCFPGDVVSLYMGAVKMPFFKYLCGSFFGTFPGVAAATVLGGNISKPSSPAFVISVGITVFMSCIAAVMCLFKRKKS